MSGETNRQDHSEPPAPPPAPAPPPRLPRPRTPDPGAAPPLRWGILGTGGIAGSMARALRAHTRQQVVAVGSRTAERGRAFAAEHHIPTAYVGSDDLLADESVDIVYIASPHSEHYRQATDAIAAGKHLLVEKAFTRTAEQAVEIAQFATASDVTVLEAMWPRFLPHFDVLRQLLEAGALGEVQVVIADHGQYFDPDRGHRLFAPELAGGALLDLGVYPVSLASMVLGAPAAVHAFGRRAFTGVDGQVSMVLDAGADHPGAQAVLNTTLFARTPTTATISGTAARVELPGPFYAPGVLTYVHRDGTTLHTDPPAIVDGGLAYEAAHLAQLVADGVRQSPLLPLTETVAVMRTLDTAAAQLG